MIEYNSPSQKSAIEAQFEAQRIAFAPIVFQASKALCDMGILKLIHESGKNGITRDEISQKLDIPPYGVQVLLEVGLSSELVSMKEDRFVLQKTGYFLLKDNLTKVNMNFVNDVCYQGMFSLQETIRTGKPSGLKVFGDWDNIYDGLSQLPEDVQKSWFEFDHYYSDHAFPKLLPLVFSEKPEKILDVGGNTGKWALQCFNYDSEVQITIADLPGQLNKAIKRIEEKGFGSRFTPYQTDILDPSLPLPSGHDVIWMSQFLDCFSDQQIVDILKKAKNAMDENTTLYILETYWDRQDHEAAAFSLHNISLYFTNMANGCSKMYHSDELKACVEKAGLELFEDKDGIGLGHTLFKCKKKTQ